MKSTGIVRRVDQLGRIVLPKELKRTYKLDTGEGVEIFFNGFSAVGADELFFQGRRLSGRKNFRTYRIL